MRKRISGDSDSKVAGWVFTENNTRRMHRFREPIGDDISYRLVKQAACFDTSHIFCARCAHDMGWQEAPEGRWVAADSYRELEKKLTT